MGTLSPVVYYAEPVSYILIAIGARPSYIASYLISNSGQFHPPSSFQLDQCN